MGSWPLPPNLHSEITGGPICFFSDHSIGSRDGRIPRYADSHACVRCVSALTEGRLTLDVHRIHKRHRRRFLEFWSLVEVADPEECWEWHGPRHRRSNTSHFKCTRHWNDSNQFGAPRVATWLSWGDIGRLPITSICRNTNCCNPLHIRIKGVPHFYYNRKLQLIDLEFNSQKLVRETQSFLQVTRECDPLRYARLERTSKDWLDLRMERGNLDDPEPIEMADDEPEEESSDRLIDILDEEDDLLDQGQS
jgi:hypothetical protein